MNRARLLGPMIGSFALALGCAGVKPDSSQRRAPRARATRPGLGGFGGSSPPPMPCQGMCTDFPPTPITDGNVPANAADIFGTPGSGAAGGPCVIEPQENTLFPNNWLRPRFRFTGGAGLYEIRLHASNQANDLVVYTTNTTWTMHKAIWTALAVHTRDIPIEVTVRSAPPGGGQVLLGSKVHFTIAPVGANGKLVYWSTSGTTYFNGQPTGTETVLNGFAVGDESVVEVLRPYVGATAQVAMQTYDQGQNKRPVKCIGCHTSTPDGSYIAFNDFYPWGAVLASGTSPAGMAPPASILGVGGLNAITQPWVGITTFSQAHWASGDRIMVAPLGTCVVNNVPAAVRPRQRPGHGPAAGPGLVRPRERRRAQHRQRRRAGPARHGLELDLRAGGGRLRGGAVVEPRRHQGAVHDDGQGEVGPPRHQRERAPLHGSVFEDRRRRRRRRSRATARRPARRSTTARCPPTTR